MAKDMTNGSPVKLILYFSIPLLIGNVFQQLYNMVDTIIVGKFIGVQALAAVGSTGSLSFLLIGFVTGLTSGFSVIISQRFGANDKKGLHRSVAISIILSIIATIIITIVSLSCVKSLLILMKTPSDIINEAYSYISVIYGGIGATIFYNLISSMLRAIGDSKTPLYFLIIASILNIILDIVFIVNFSMGVAGAAYATVIAQLISGILCLIYTLKKYDILHLTKDDWKINKDFTLKHLKIGLPMALQFSITAVGVMIVQVAINGLGSITIAAYTAASKVQQVIIQPSITFGVSIATYCAQNLGANKIHRIKEGVKKGSILSVGFSIIAAILIFIFGEQFIKLFIDGTDATVISLSRQYLNITVFFYPALALIFVYRNALQGIGDTFVPMMAGAAELCARILVAFTLPAAIGYLGICLADPLAWIAAAVPLGITYFKRINTLLNKEMPTTNLINEVA